MGEYEQEDQRSELHVKRDGTIKRRIERYGRTDDHYYLFHGEEQPQLKRETGIIKILIVELEIMEDPGEVSIVVSWIERDIVIVDVSMKKICR